MLGVVRMLAAVTLVVAAPFAIGPEARADDCCAPDPADVAAGAATEHDDAGCPGEDEGGRCPRSCSDCACCAHAPAAPAPLGVSPVRVVSRIGWVEVVPLAPPAGVSHRLDRPPRT